MFRFTIRDLLWVTVVAALCVGSWLDRRHLVHDNARLQQQDRLNRRLISEFEAAICRVQVQVSPVKSIEPIETQKAYEVRNP
jgi:hypothetical protein